MIVDSKQILQFTRLGMRKAFGSIMCSLAELDENIIVIAADVASSAGLEEFANKFPNQFYNIGIAEQNMVGIAAGLAKEGENVFVTSFAPFASMRAYEAIRTLLGYMNLNVKVVGLASGFSLGVQGNTHYSFEDIAIMRSIPNMQIFSPADCAEEIKVLEYLSQSKGPAYVRLTGIDGSPGVHKADYSFSSSHIEQIKQGDNIAILATGSIVNECVRASRALARENKSVAVYNVPTLKPFDSVLCKKIAAEYEMIVSVEEHNVIGGLGSIIADQIASMKQHGILLKIGIYDSFIKAGDYSTLLKTNSLDAIGIKNIITENYKAEE